MKMVRGMKIGDRVVILKGKYAGREGVITDIHKNPTIIGLRCHPKYFITVRVDNNHEVYTLGEIKRIKEGNKNE